MNEPRNESSGKPEGPSGDPLDAGQIDPSPASSGGEAAEPMRTPWQRRLMYGANVAGLVAAVAVIVIFANWLAAERAQRWGGWARLDLTATRKYSLSDQTRQVLGNLDQPVRITTVFAEGVGMPAELQRRLRYFRDLLQEYERLGGDRVEVEHVDPTTDMAAYGRLIERVKSVHADEVEPMRSAIDAARVAMEQTRQRLARINAFVAQNIGMLERESPALAQWMRRRGLPLSEGAAEQLGFDALTEAIDGLADQRLPEYAQLRSDLLERLRRLNDRGLSQFTQRLDEVREGESPGAVVEFASGLSTLVNTTSDELDGAIEKLEAAEAEEYAATRRSLQQSNSVLVSSDDDLAVIELDEVYHGSQTGDEGEAATEQRFRGEEAVTSAVIGLTREVKPMVVFVNPLPGAAVGGGGLMSYVGTRLESMGFQVEEWRTARSHGPGGRAMPTRRPEPGAGQPVVWVYLAPPADPQMMFSGGLEPAKEDFAETLGEGGDVLVFAPFWPGAGMGATGAQAPPYVQPLASIGINVQSDKRLFSQIPGPDGQTMAVPLMQITDWPEAHVIGRALQGQVGILGGLAMHRGAPMSAATPIDYEQDRAMKVWPLVRTPRHAWAETGLGGEVTPDAADARGPFTVALAAERGRQRLVVIGDAMFAADPVTQIGDRDFLSGRLLRARYPANAELFLNSVYWLAGTEELIATSARTQDVRRYGPVSDAAGRAVMWIALAGLPVLCLLGGGVVWFVRRK